MKLNLSYRTSNDSTTFSEWQSANNNTLSIVGLFSRYFQYKADFNDFVIQNSSGGLNLVITNPEGNLLIKGYLNQSQSSLSPTLSSFIRLSNNDNYFTLFIIILVKSRNKLGQWFDCTILKRKFVVNLSLLVTRKEGIPLWHHTYDGNINDVTEFKEFIKTLTSKVVFLTKKCKKITLILDKGNILD